MPDTLPQQGGSYTRDPNTGELTPSTPGTPISPTAPATPATEE